MNTHLQPPPSIALCLELLTEPPLTPLPGGRFAKFDPYLGRLVELSPAALATHEAAQLHVQNGGAQ